MPWATALAPAHDGRVTSGDVATARGILKMATCSGTRAFFLPGDCRAEKDLEHYVACRGQRCQNRDAARRKIGWWGRNTERDTSSYFKRRQRIAVSRTSEASKHSIYCGRSAKYERTSDRNSEHVSKSHDGRDRNEATTFAQMNKNDSMSRYGPLVGAIDEGTSNAKFLVFAADTAEVLTYHQVSISQKYPKEGWVEQDALEILRAVRECLKQTVFNLKQLTIDPADIVAIGITNQRETTVVWDSVTGEPLYNAIVWMDMRTTSIMDDILKGIRNENKNYLKPLCGLPISPYFSALKLKWLLENVPRVQEALAAKRLMFGTIDSWLIWNLTGGANGGVHSTDVTNASRTMLMNIVTLKWDPTLLSFFKIPPEILPQIRSSSEIYGYIQDELLQGVPISGCLGDQQSALVGQMCLQQGQAKSTYGTGCFLLYNTGTAIVDSSHGLLTTVAYQLGAHASPVYALEGSVAIAGAVIQWLKDNLGILNNIKDCETIIEQIRTGNHIVFVPAFAGLYAPYWRKDARSVICGISENTTSAHIVKAALQAVCFQTRDILEAMKEDTGLVLSKLLVDGAMTNNDLLMQMQADICGIPVVRPLMCETTALGVAIAAGSAEGIRKWDVKIDAAVPSDIFLPSITENERDILYSQWKMGIDRSLSWEPIQETNDISVIDDTEDIHKATAPGVFIIGTIILLMVAKYRSTL